MVPSGVLKRGPRSTERRIVILSDGIRPGTGLDEAVGATSSRVVPDKPLKFNMPTINEKTNSFIPEVANELTPVLLKEWEFKFIDNNLPLLQRLCQEESKFAINKNFFVTRELCNALLFQLCKFRFHSSGLVHQQNSRHENDLQLPLTIDELEIFNLDR
jgi:hypothetical protein